MRASIPAAIRRLAFLAPCALLALASCHSREDELPASRAGPAFSLRQEGDEWWLVTPRGQPFFSLGVCVVAQGESRESFDPENPGYAAWQHYSRPTAWADATLARLKGWGFTTIGGWSDYAALRSSAALSLWLTPVLHIGSTAGAPWFDLWDEEVVERMDRIAREQILPLRDDPRVIGYYSDNEMGWWNATLFEMTLEHPPSSEQRGRLIALLKETYASDWRRLLLDFDPTDVSGWDELELGGVLRLRPGGRGVRVERRFLGLVAERYYQLVHDIIRKYDQRALILGDRYQSFYYPEVARAAAAHVDVVSTNLNAQWSDGTFLRCYLDTLHALTGKPILVSEIYMAAAENRSGNRNSQGIFPVAATQSDRAAALQKTLTLLARTPYVVGADWFQYYDEARHGREDGENFNFGLVDIHDQPYAELTAAFTGTEWPTLKSEASSPRPDASLGVPPAPPDPLDGFEIWRALLEWDRERGFVRPASELPMADLYLCWTPEAIYLGVYTLDFVEDAYYESKRAPKQDRPYLVVELNATKPMRVRFGAGREAIPSEPGLRIEHLSGAGVNVRNVIALELRAERLGRKAFAAGDAIELRASVASHGEAYRTEWRGTFTLAERQ